MANGYHNNTAYTVGHNQIWNFCGFPISSEIIGMGRMEWL